MSGDAEQIRAAIVRRYGRLAEAAASGQPVTDCGQACFGAAAYDDDAAGLPEDALRASLGCGNPVAGADLSPGDVVLDLGSAPEMIRLATANAAAADVRNVNFLCGTIEDIPLPDAQVDAVISNCVINLSADKRRVLDEAFRVLRPGGRLGVSEVITAGDPGQRTGAEPRAGCAAGTVTAGEYRSQLLAAGFTQISITPTAATGGGLAAAVIQARRPAAPSGTLVRPMRAPDAAQVLAIYQAGLDTGQASFETTAPTWEAFDAAKLPLHRHVALDAVTGRVLGWAAASAVSDRCVYAGVVEHSVYVAPDARRGGIGAALLAALTGSAEAAGIWTVQSGVFPENTASLRLHERAGFRVVGTRERIGCHHGRWRDVVLIERRSRSAGAS